jgi:uncharacterized membrane protein YkvA (DUF1232 family)
MMSERFSKFWSFISKLPFNLPNDSAAYTRSKLGPKLKIVVGKIPFLDDVLALYFCAIDSKTPARAKAIAFAALAYFIMPVDLIPDTIPVAGMLDDASVIALALWTLEPFITDEHRRKARALLAKLRGGKPDDFDNGGAGAVVGPRV